MIHAVIVGAGGHGRVVASALGRMAELNPQIHVSGFTDADYDPQSRPDRGNLSIIANDDLVVDLVKAGSVTHYCLGIGGTRGGIDVRRSLTERYNRFGLIPLTVIDPSAFVDASVEIEPGTFVGPGAIINSGVFIGAHAIINSGAIVEHDCRIGSFTHIAPGAVLSGDCNVGENTLIGTGASVRQGIAIGSNTTVGVGSCVVGAVSDNSIVKGNPAA